MPAGLLKSLVAVIVYLFTLVQADAQPIFTHVESIESTVANADAVVIAKLVKFTSGEKDGDQQVHEATIAVEEVLKRDIFTFGPSDRQGIHVRCDARVLANWQERSCRLLVAMDDSAPDATKVIELNADCLEVLTENFKLLRDPETVICAAKETVRGMPAPVKRIHTFQLNVPREMFIGTKWEEYHGLILSVPVDERLEKRSLDYLKSDKYMLREEGVRALRYFKSDGNIARVRPLLNDPGSALEADQENNGVEVRFYGVRQEAYRTLKTWGVDVEKPKIREIVRK
jgi:hypothetical protein